MHMHRHTSTHMSKLFFTCKGSRVLTDLLNKYRELRLNVESTTRKWLIWENTKLHCSVKCSITPKHFSVWVNGRTDCASVMNDYEHLYQSYVPILSFLQPVDRWVQLHSSLLMSQCLWLNLRPLVDSFIHLEKRPNLIFLGIWITSYLHRTL